MAIVESVVKAHHGFICACQTDGGGLTIVVVLPIAPVEIPVMSAPGGKPAKGAKQQKSGKSLFAPKSAKSAKPSKPDSRTGEVSNASRSAGRYAIGRIGMA